MSKKKPFDHAYTFFAVIVLIVVGTGVFVWFQIRSDRIGDMVDSGTQIGVLWVVENEGVPLFTQVFLYNPVTRRGAFFDVPGNVGAILGTLNRVDRIEALYVEGDIDLYRSTIERLLGTEIPFHVTTTIDDVARLVDLSSGIRLFIDVESAGGSEAILLPSGNVVLDGSKVGTYLLHYAPADGEDERIARVQAFMQSLFDGLGQSAVYLNHQRVRPFVSDSISSNMDARAFQRFLVELDRLETDRLVYRRVQGTTRLVETGPTQQELLFPHFEGQWLRQTVRQVQESLAAEGERFEDNAVITLEILNGTPTPGLARRTQDLLQGYGFNVVGVGNAESSDIEETLVIDRTGNTGFAERVAGIIQAERVLTDRIPDGDAAVTLILGRDFDGTIVR